ncbi:hypothetical protein WJ967_30360 [Achromobacter xylosoxidans]
MELELAGTLTPGWQVMAGYTYNQSTYLKDSENGPAGTRYDTQTPRHLFKLSTMVTLPGALNAWRVGGAVRLQVRSACRATTCGRRAMALSIRSCRTRRAATWICA